uniref:Uncharacterized protein n=1 Tax=Rhizophora mucronata TaxID=61149 RepID=A0A2P2QC31_RHIMU
MVLDSSLP